MFNYRISLTCAFICLSLSVFGSLADTAAIVAVAHVTSGQQTGTAVSATLQVDKVLKGNVVPGQVLTVHAVAQTVSGTHALIGSGIWFLAASAADPNIWNIVPPVRGNIPFEFLYLPIPQTQTPSPRASAAADAVSVNDRIAIEIAPVLQQTTPGKVEFNQLATALLTLPYSQIVGAQLEGLLSNPVPELQMIALAGLLRNGRTDYLNKAMSLPIGMRSSPFSAELVSAVSNISDTNAQVVSDLGRIVVPQNSPSGLRIAAATALARIHTTNTLPFLAQMLASPDEKMQLIAINAFSMFVENLPVKTSESVTTMSWLKPEGPAIYKTAETDRHLILTNSYSGSIAEYVTFWRSWYLSKQSSLQ